MRKYLYVFLMLMSAFMYFMVLMVELNYVDKLFFGTGFFTCFIASAILVLYAEKGNKID